MMSVAVYATLVLKSYLKHVRCLCILILMFCVVGSAVLALLLAGYLAQHYLPPPKPKIVGIDLGEKVMIEKVMLAFEVNHMS